MKTFVYLLFRLRPIIFENGEPATSMFIGTDHHSRSFFFHSDALLFESVRCYVQGFHRRHCEKYTSCICCCACFLGLGFFFFSFVCCSCSSSLTIAATAISLASSIAQDGPNSFVCSSSSHCS